MCLPKPSSLTYCGQLHRKSPRESTTSAPAQSPPVLTLLQFNSDKSDLIYNMRDEIDRPARPRTGAELNECLRRHLAAGVASSNWFVSHCNAQTWFFQGGLALPRRDFRCEGCLLENSAALNLFEDLLRQSVFHEVNAKPFQSLDLYCQWQVIQVEAELRPSTEWPLAALLRELTIGLRLFLARFRVDAGHILLTNDVFEKTVAQYAA